VPLAALGLCAAAWWIRDARSVTILVSAALLAPAVTAGSLMTAGYGVLDTRFESAATSDITKTFMSQTSATASRLVDDLGKLSGPGAYPFAAYGSAMASPFIFATGKETYPAGGFTGNAPVPTTAELARLVAAGRIRLVLASHPVTGKSTG
jgi:hypothetical protein